MSVVEMELRQETGQSRLLVNAEVDQKYSGPIIRGEHLDQLIYSFLKEILLLEPEVLRLVRGTWILHF